MHKDQTLDIFIKSMVSLKMSILQIWVTWASKITLKNLQLCSSKIKGSHTPCDVTRSRSIDNSSQAPNARQSPASQAPSAQTYHANTSTCRISLHASNAHNPGSFHPDRSQPLKLLMHRPLNSHGATVRLTVSAVISRSHGGGLISHGLLSVSTKDLPVLTRQEV